jgi:hypothetical protein
MKTQNIIITTIISAFAFSNINAQNDVIAFDNVIVEDTTNTKKSVPDTTKINLKNTKILIISNCSENGDVSIETEKEGPNKRGNFDSDYVWAGFQLAVNGYLNNKNSINIQEPYKFMELRTENSFQIGLNFYEERINIFRDKVNLITGLGLTWNNYRFANDITLARSSDFPDLEKETPLFGFEDTRQYKKTKFAVSSLNVPLLLNFCTTKKKSEDDKQFNLSFGVIGSFNYRTVTKTVFDGNKKDVKEKEKGDFGVNPFSAHATVRLKYGWFNLFANYSLTPLFKSDRGPELYPFSIGLGLISF